MKILEYPKHQCEHCGCVYTFSNEDFKEERKYLGVRQPNGLCRPKDVYENRVYVECPICGAQHIINRKEDVNER